MMPEDSTVPYVLLVRHAARERSWDVAERDHPMLNWQEPMDIPGLDRTVTVPDAKVAGVPQTYALAGALADELVQRGVIVTRIFTSEHLVAQQTGQIFKTVLDSRFEPAVVECAVSSHLTPGSIDLDQVESLIATGTHHSGNASKPAVMLVGHQPSLTEIADKLLAGRLPANVLPLANSEIAGIECGEKPRLLWLITDKSDDLRKDLEGKIKSKLDVAKFLLGAMVLNFGLYLQFDLWQVNTPVNRLLLLAAMMSALASLGFTIVTLFSYDRLMMPRAFWGSDQGSAGPPSWSVRRPPSQDQLVLFYEMTHVWNRFFTPAIILASVAIGLLVVLVANHNMGSVLVCSPVTLLMFAGAVTLALLLPLVIYSEEKPRLGVDD